MAKMCSKWPLQLRTKQSAENNSFFQNLRIQHKCIHLDRRHWLQLQFLPICATVHKWTWRSPASSSCTLAFHCTFHRWIGTDFQNREAVKLDINNNNNNRNCFTTSTKAQEHNHGWCRGHPLWHHPLWHHHLMIISHHQQRKPGNNRKYFKSFQNPPRKKNGKMCAPRVKI